MTLNNRLRLLASVSVPGFLVALVVFGPPSSVRALSGQSEPEIIYSDHQDVSPPLREIRSTPREAGFPREKHLGLLPIGPAGPLQADPALQTSGGPRLAATPGLNFAGVGDGDYGFIPNAAPPDTNGAVGAIQYVQWVNESFAVFDKTTGALVKGPIAGNTLFANLGGSCATNNDGDPIVQYDKAAGRWIL